MFHFNLKCQVGRYVVVHSHHIVIQRRIIVLYGLLQKQKVPPIWIYYMYVKVYLPQEVSLNWSIGILVPRQKCFFFQVRLKILPKIIAISFSYTNYLINRVLFISVLHSVWYISIVVFGQLVSENSWWQLSINIDA